MARRSRGDDPSSKSGAEKLLQRLAAYWGRQGFTPALWLESAQWRKGSEGDPRKVIIWAVRSNMVGGQPQ